jgi:hypothetical protein
MTTQAYLYELGDMLRCPSGWIVADTVGDDVDESKSYAMHFTGTVSTLPAEDENEAVRLLRKVVKEVTGRDVDEPSKPRIGFLP